MFPTHPRKHSASAPCFMTSYYLAIHFCCQAQRDESSDVKITVVYAGTPPLDSAAVGWGLVAWRHGSECTGFVLSRRRWRFPSKAARRQPQKEITFAPFFHFGTLPNCIHDKLLMPVKRFALAALDGWAHGAKSHSRVVSGVSCMFSWFTLFTTSHLCSWCSRT